MVHCFCFQNIWFNKRTHANEHRNAYWLSTKCVLASDLSSASSWLVQPVKELSSAAGLCAGRGCALIRQLANLPQSSVSSNHQKGTDSTFHFVGPSVNGYVTAVTAFISRVSDGRGQPQSVFEYLINKGIRIANDYLYCYLLLFLSIHIFYRRKDGHFAHGYISRQHSVAR